MLERRRNSVDIFALKSIRRYVEINLYGNETYYIDDMKVFVAYFLKLRLI